MNFEFWQYIVKDYIKTVIINQWNNNCHQSELDAQILKEIYETFLTIINDCNTTNNLIDKVLIEVNSYLDSDYCNLACQWLIQKQNNLENVVKDKKVNSISDLRNYLIQNEEKGHYFYCNNSDLEDIAQAVIFESSYEYVNAREAKHDYELTQDELIKVIKKSCNVIIRELIDRNNFAKEFQLTLKNNNNNNYPF